jgi:hypothetical protein
VTWEQFERVAKFTAGFAWGTLELWLWGGRPVPLMFIGMGLGITEAAHMWSRLNADEKKDKA